MSDILNLFQSNPLLTLFAMIGLGLWLGNIQIKGVNLGSSGVIFVALLAGHLGCSIPSGIGQIGLALFVYTVGIGAGGRFFGALKREGRELAKLAVVVVGSAALTTWGLAKLFSLPAEMAAGIFAGAMTSTPALAAATEGAGALESDVVVGYGIAYPFGVIGVVLFVQLLPKLLGLKIEEDSAETKGSREAEVRRQLVQATNTNLFGKRIIDSSVAEIEGCRISRVWKNDHLSPVSYEDVFEKDSLVLLVGEVRAVKLATDLIGVPSDRNLVLDADNERREMVVTERQAIGKSLRELGTFRQHGVMITRIRRLDFTFVPKSDTMLEKGDSLTVVGTKERMADFEKVIGHNPQAFSETSLVSLAIGLAFGVLLGKFQIPMPWGDTFSLGLAGGPLLVALLLGHFGRVGGVIGFIPRPTRLLLQEMGLVFFLADAGIKGGASMGEAIQAQGIQIFIVGGLITIIPLIIGYVFARRLFKMSLGQSLGGICGGMTSTPALGAIVSKTPQQAPIISYATVYPVAIILMALLAKLLIKLI